MCIKLIKGCNKYMYLMTTTYHPPLEQFITLLRIYTYSSVQLNFVLAQYLPCWCHQLCEVMVVSAEISPSPTENDSGMNPSVPSWDQIT